jgi:ABC-type transport system substrate-binding protein
MPSGEYRLALSNQLGPAGPITSITAPDSHTVVTKLAYPYGGMPQLFQEILYIYPKEADGRYDAKGLMLGSGPWVIESYQPSVGINYKRHPEWHFRNRPFLDRIERPIITEQASRTAQFRAHRIHTVALPQDEVITTKKEVPELNLYAMGLPTVGYNQFVFGLRPDSPFRDERVRQAISMAIDRDAIIEVFGNVDRLRQEGLDVTTRYHTHLGLTPDNFWLDPKSSDFGDASKIFTLNLEDAKRLASAAGHSSVKTVFSRNPGAISEQITTALNMLKQNLGWEITENVIQAQGGPTISLLDQKGDFDGITWTSYTMKADPTLYLYHKYHTTGSSLRVPERNDLALDKMFDDLRAMQDDKKRVDAWHSIQRYLGGKMWLVPLAGGSDQFQLAWPELKNFGVFRLSAFDVAGAEQIAWNYWLNETGA